MLTLIDLAELKSRLDISTSNDDATLTGIIDIVSKAIEDELGYGDLTIDDAIVEVLDVRSGQRVFRVQRSPVREIVSVKNDEGQDWAGTTAVDTDDYVLGKHGRIEFKYGSEPADVGPQALQVTYKGGRWAAQANVDEWLVENAMLYAVQVFRRRKDMDSTSETLGAGRTQHRGALAMPALVRENLSFHRAPWKKMASPFAKKAGR